MRLIGSPHQRRSPRRGIEPLSTGRQPARHPAASRGLVHPRYRSGLSCSSHRRHHLISLAGIRPGGNRTPIASLGVSLAATAPTYRCVGVFKEPIDLSVDPGREEDGAMHQGLRPRSAQWLFGAHPRQRSRETRYGDELGSCWVIGTYGDEKRWIGWGSNPQRPRAPGLQPGTATCAVSDPRAKTRIERNEVSREKTKRPPRFPWVAQSVIECR